MFIPRRLNDYSPVSDNEKLWHNWVKSIELECRVIVTVDPLAPMQELNPRVLQEWVDKEQTYVDRPTKDEGVVYRTLCFLPKSKLIYHRKQKRWYYLSNNIIFYFPLRKFIIGYHFFFKENITIYKNEYKNSNLQSNWLYKWGRSVILSQVVPKVFFVIWTLGSGVPKFEKYAVCFLINILVKWLLDFFALKFICYSLSKI